VSTSAVTTRSPACATADGKVRGEPRALSHEEFARLLKTPDRRTRQGKRDLALLHLFGSAGLRRSEPATFLLGDIDERRRPAATPCDQELNVVVGDRPLRQARPHSSRTARRARGDRHVGQEPPAGQPSARFCRCRASARPARSASATSSGSSAVTLRLPTCPRTAALRPCAAPHVLHAPRRHGRRHRRHPRACRPRRHPHYDRLHRRQLRAAGRRRGRAPATTPRHLANRSVAGTRAIGRALRRSAAGASITVSEGCGAYAGSAVSWRALRRRPCANRAAVSGIVMIEASSARHSSPANAPADANQRQMISDKPGA
jgi:hypothetical protein